MPANHPLQSCEPLLPFLWCYHAPCEDGDFPRDVHAGEIVPRVWLRVAGGLSLRHDAAEAGALHEAVEDVAEGPAEDALYLGQLNASGLSSWRNICQDAWPTWQRKYKIQHGIPLNTPFQKARAVLLLLSGKGCL